MDITIKENIQTHFNSAKNSYDKNCFVQLLVCQKIINLLKNHNCEFEKIADMACGTGLSTQYIDRHLLFELCYAVDFSNDLLQISKNKKYTKNIHFIVNDFDSITLPTEYLDLIFCNMGLQWSLNISQTLLHWKKLISTTGIIAFSIPLYDTFSEIHPTHKNVQLSQCDLFKLIYSLEFKIIAYDYFYFTQSFQNTIQALQSIKKVGADYLIPCKKNSFNRKKNQNILKKTPLIKNKSCSLSYHIGLFIIKI